MARITTGGLISDIRGKMGDQIFSRNKYGAYVKAWAEPTGTPTSRQNTVRGWLYDATETWKASNEPSRVQWINFARTFKQDTRRIKTARLTGFNLFVRAYMYDKLTAGTGITTPPLWSQPLNSKITFTNVDVFTFQIELTSNGLNSQWRSLVFASDIKNPTVYSPNSCEFKYLTSGAVSDSGTSFNLYSVYSSVWQALEGWEGQYIWLKWQNVNVKNGQNTPPQYQRVYINGE